MSTATEETAATDPYFQNLFAERIGACNTGMAPAVPMSCCVTRSNAWCTCSVSGLLVVVRASGRLYLYVEVYGPC